MPPTFVPHPQVPDVLLVERELWNDRRGWFTETYRRSDYRAQKLHAQFVQENQSLSTSKFVLRGLHYQIEPHAHAKLVRCLEGRIFDVAVDLRQGSPTYKRHAATLMGAADTFSVWIPIGFAHGFLSLTDRASVLYKQTTEYSPAHERAIRWDDPELHIQWPLDGMRPLMSGKDEAAPLLADAEAPFRFTDPKNSLTGRAFKDRK